MKSFKRSQRVADQIKRDVSVVIAEMLRDKAGLMVTISGVEVSNDLRHAKIFYTVLGNEEKRERAEKIFSRATGYIQSELARRLRMRRIPEISLNYDTSLVEGMRMVSLIDDVMSETEDENDRTD